MAVDDLPETPQTSSRRVAHSGIDFVLGSSDDSDASLDDIRTFLSSARKGATAPSSSPAKPLPRKKVRWAGGKAKGAPAPPARPAPPPARLDLAALVRKKQKENESKARIAEIERKLKDESPRVVRSRVTEDSIAELIDDGAGKGRAKRLLAAMVRGGALGSDPVWCFFDEGGPTPGKLREYPAKAMADEPLGEILADRTSIISPFLL
jgi:hypothetical protein